MFYKFTNKLFACAYPFLITLSFLHSHFGQTSQAVDIRIKAQQFIEQYTATWSKLDHEASLANWKSYTMIIEGDDSNSKATVAALEKLADFTGSKANIDEATKYLAQKDKLTDLQIKQLKLILYNAAGSPEIAKEFVKERIAAETEAAKKLNSFDFKIDGKSFTRNQVMKILRESSHPEQRRKAWIASKELGIGLKKDLTNLRRLRNATVTPLGYKSFFSYQVSDYGMTAEEMMRLMNQINRELRPLYRELHTWARYELAKKYNRPVSDKIPADLLPNAWGGFWSELVKVEGLDINAALKNKTPEWIVRQGEDFYVSLGFPRLPQSFWEKSSLYPLPPDAKYKKNNFASAWHIDLDKDVRLLMTLESDANSYETAHHELGHVYYFISYSNKSVPLLLRSGANRAYHEAIGTMIGTAAMQKPFLEARGLVSQNAKTDEMHKLLREALTHIVFMPFSAGTMTEFEYELYEKDLPENQFNRRWWELVEKHQGIAPPTERSEEFCDACTRTHIIDDPAQFYDYAIASLLQFQIHDYIAREILKQDPHATNYYGNKEVGVFLRKIMSPGNSRDWRVVLKETTGESLNAKAMHRYFEPLTNYLKKVNAGRKHTLPDLPTQ